MPENKSNKDKNQKPDELLHKKQDTREKAFIQMLDIKRDTNMTRIYSVIYKPNFFNHELKKDEWT